MIFKTSAGESFDTTTDLTAPERHVLQKLFLWSSMASSLEEFRQKKDNALFRGWNHSGPVQESEALRSIIHELENRLSHRLGE